MFRDARCNCVRAGHGFAPLHTKSIWQPIEARKNRWRTEQSNQPPQMNAASKGTAILSGNNVVRSIGQGKFGNLLATANAERANDATMECSIGRNRCGPLTPNLVEIAIPHG